jgi:hypothetical protein
VVSICACAESAHIAHLLEGELRLSSGSAHAASCLALLLRLLAGLEQRRQVLQTVALRLLILHVETMPWPGAAAGMSANRGLFPLRTSAAQQMSLRRQV